MDRKTDDRRGAINLSADELKEVEKLGALFMEPSDVAIVMERDELKFEREMMNRKSDVYKAYWKGFLKSKTEVNESIVGMAKKDSSPAQTLTTSMIKEVERKFRSNE